MAFKMKGFNKPKPPGGNSNSPFPLFGVLGLLGKRKRRGKKRKTFEKDADIAADARISNEEDDRGASQSRDDRDSPKSFFSFLKGGGRLKDWMEERRRRKGERSNALRGLLDTNDFLPF